MNSTKDMSKQPLAIAVETGWNGTRDVEEYTDRFGEPEGDYFAAALDQVCRGAAELEYVTTGAVPFLLKAGDDSAEQAAQGLSLLGRLELIRELGRARALNEQARAWLDEAIDDATWVGRECDRLLEKFLRQREHVWLEELAQLADQLTAIAMQIREAIWNLAPGCESFQWAEVMAGHDEGARAMGANAQKPLLSPGVKHDIPMAQIFPTSSVHPPTGAGRPDEAERKKVEAIIGEMNRVVGALCTASHSDPPKRKGPRHGYRTAKSGAILRIREL